MLTTIKRLIPKRAKPFIRYARTLGRGRECPICGIELRKFLPLSAMWRGDLEIKGVKHASTGFETLSLSNYECPRCFASDRCRLYRLYLEERLPRAPAADRPAFIHFAPEASQLTAWIKAHPGITYRSADLFRDDVDDKVDICRMTAYEDARFDIALCSHILEHVDAPEAATRELFRILKPGGWAIVMVPILTTIAHTFEDPTVTDEAGRWRHFGQGDHLRVFAKGDFVTMLGNAGFTVQQLGAAHFSEDRLRRAGIDLKAVLYVAEKPARV